MSSIDSRIAELKRSIKKTKAEKGSISKKFRLDGVNAQERDELKQQMQEVSVRLKSLEVDLKLLLNPAPQKNKDETKALPQRFLSPTKRLGGTVKITRVDFDSGEESVAWLIHHPRSSIYHWDEICSFLEKPSSHICSMLVARTQSSEIVGVLPVIIMKTSLFGKFATSLPIFNYGGPITEYMDVFDSLLSASKALVAEHDLKYLEVRTLTKSETFASSGKKVSMLLSLPKTEELFDAQLGAKVRAQAKKALENDPKIVFGQGELLDDFYTVMSTNMRDLGTPFYSKKWFHELLTVTKDFSVLVVVYHRGEPLAAAFLIRQQTIMEIPWASTVRKANKLNLNMWMYSNILKYAIKNGCAWFDFGRSTLDAPTHKFKRQWGAREVQHHWYNFSADENENLESLNPDNPKFKLAIYVWKKLPVWLTRIIGPHIARQIP